MESTDPAGSRPPEGTSSPSDEGIADLDRLTAQLAEAERNLADMRDTVLRERAEIENQRRRLQRDLEQARRFANEKLLADLLPVLDNLERGLAAPGTDYAALRGGVELTLRELTKVVETNGLKVIDPVGSAFDPEQHQAMQMVASAEHPAGAVVAVFQKGYILNDRLLRPALVTVAKAAD